MIQRNSIQARSATALHLTNGCAIAKFEEPALAPSSPADHYFSGLASESNFRRVLVHIRKVRIIDELPHGDFHVLWHGRQKFVDYV